MDAIRDFRVELPDKPGQLADICEALGQKGINVRSLAGVAGSPPILAIITDHQQETRATLNGLQLKFEEAELLTVSFRNVPGEIASFSRRLANANINISAVYMLGEAEGRGLIAFSVSDVVKARKILKTQFV